MKCLRFYCTGFGYSTMTYKPGKKTPPHYLERNAHGSMYWMKTNTNVCQRRRRNRKTKEHHQMKRKKEKQALFIRIKSGLENLNRTLRWSHSNRKILWLYVEIIKAVLAAMALCQRNRDWGFGNEDSRSPENTNFGSLTQHVWHSYSFIRTHEMAGFAQRASRVSYFLLTPARYLYFHYIVCFSSRQYSWQHEPRRLGINHCKQIKEPSFPTDSTPMGPN